MSAWLITGAASGLGHSLAEEVLGRGENVVLTSRRLEPMNDLAAKYPDSSLVLSLDVTNADQRAEVVARAERQFGGIDVLVNNAGIDFVGAIEEQDESDYRAVFEVNFFAPLALTRLVLPGMRERDRGTIVNISSMDGLASLPANGLYSASKFALEGLTEALWQEIEPLGLRAIVIQPGSFRTGIEQRTLVSGQPIDAYAATAGAFRQMMGSLTPEMFPGDPARAAKAVYEVVTSENPPHWVPLGSDAYRRIGVKLEALQREFEAGKELAHSTDYPGSGPAVL
ncbi:SDR family NAD(P)-dependent oxidoreductase [Kribbella sp. VKM Ac-2566]|uniref:SDR family NAD(P)-dependent oxidoreductase n=1 Tax=Kribbella sp. VKM Ac-2566 TaxID=2512218 RepID=UPI0010645772|nr:SDR family NAD(P)-dependent oxidoreductase [Kribbella sp. VKM Ac-2566]TDW98558.1 short-subunit dehydrogenase [Kribbella sp. VKM Ac-2566]